jgi:hypothetical protein
MSTVPNLVTNVSSGERRSWIFFGHNVPRSEIIFVLQAVLVFFLTIASVICIILSKTCEDTTVWVAILSSSVGYMLPAPRP